MWLGFSVSAGLGFLATVWTVYFLKVSPGTFALSFPALPFPSALYLALSGRSDRVPWSEIFKSTAMSGAVTVISLLLGVGLALALVLIGERLEMRISSKLSILAFIPEVMLLVYTWQIFGERGIFRFENHQLVAALMITLFVVLRSLGEFSKYMGDSYEEYSSGVTYYLMRVRKIRRRWWYTAKNVFYDSMSSLVFEIPMIMSYLAVMEMSLDFNGISRSFFSALVYRGNAPVVMRRAAVIALMLLVLQAVVHYVVSATDRRRVE